MANEITVLLGDVSETYNLLFIFPIATPIKVGGSGPNVVPTPSSSLSVLAASILTTGEKTNLDSGDSMFEIVAMTKTVGDSPSQLADKARIYYDDAKAAALAKYTKVYQYVGTRVNR